MIGQTRRALVLGGLAGGALMACGLPGQDGGQSVNVSAPATITYMDCGQARSDFYGGEPLRRFKELQPQVTVEMEVLECGPVFLEKMMTLMVAGTPPDVWDIGQGVFGEYVKSGQALVLDPFIAKDRTIDFADFEPTSMYSIEGKRHMLPYDTGVNVLYYNEDAWQRAGLPNPRQLWAQKKWDWAALLDAARRLTGDAPDGKRYGIGVISSALWQSGVFLWQNGADWADWTKNVQTVDRPAAIEAIQWMADLAQRYGVMPAPAVNQTERPTFANGRIAMEMGFSFGRSTYMKMQGVRWNVAHLPWGKAGHHVHVARGGTGITAKTKQPEASWRWLTHITGKEACLLATRAGTVHPPRKSVANTDAFLKPSGVTADFKPFVESVPYGQFGGPHEKRGDLHALLVRRLPAAFNGELSAQALAAELAPQFQQILNQGKALPDVKI